MTNTQSHSWEAQYQVPPWLLDGLCKEQPQCRLFLRLPYSSNIAHTIAGIRDSQQLCSLEVTIANSQHQAFAELDQLLMQTKTLRSFSIYFFIDDQSSTIPGTSLGHFRICRYYLDLSSAVLLWVLVLAGARISIGALQMVVPSITQREISVHMRVSVVSSPADA